MQNILKVKEKLWGAEVLNDKEIINKELFCLKHGRIEGELLKCETVKY